MSWRGTLVLALIIAVIGAYLWFEETPAPQRDAPQTLLGEPRRLDPTKAVRHLLDFAPADAVAVRLEHDGHTRETTRTEGRWPGTADAAINDFLKNLTELGVLAEIPAAPADLKDYGLQPPRSVVAVQRRGDAAPLILEIGDHNPPTTGVYVRIGKDGPVLLAGALVAWEFDKAFRALAAPSPAS